MIKKAPLKCDISGHQLAYHSEGSGETILLVHGITTYSFIWRKIVPLLKDNYTVVSIDLLGCGDSDKPLDVPYSIKNHASILKTFTEKLNIERFHFIGHDIGGGIGQIYAVNYPESIYDLTLINTVAYDFWPVQPIITMRTPIMRQLAMASLNKRIYSLLIRRGLFHKERLTSELMDYFWKPMKSKQGRKAFLHFAASLNNQDLIEIEAKLHNLKLPVLIIRGEADLYLNGTIANKLETNLLNSQLVKISTGGHFIQEDEPDILSNEIKQFFKDK